MDPRTETVQRAGPHGGSGVTLYPRCGQYPPKRTKTGLLGAGSDRLGVGGHIRQTGDKYANWKWRPE